MNLEPFFAAKRIAVIGASREPGKIGNVIFSNLIKRDFQGTAYPVNPNATEILGHACYPTVKAIPEKIELAVIAVPAQLVPKVIDDCGRKGIRHVIIISSGFRETGNIRLDKQLEQVLKKNKILAIGPNCLGVLDTSSRLDTLFLPPERLLRPKQGGISFISQSGALSSAVLDLASQQGYGFAKFISYGNAMNIDESDLLAYLADDPATDVICLYVEGVKDGKKFLKAARKAAQAKPVIVLKGGTTEAGSRATLSHTGSLAGTAEVYLGAFKQARLAIAHDIDEMLDYLKIFDKLKTKPRGNCVQVITNGGGYGIITADEIAQAKNLKMATLSTTTARRLKKNLPPIAIIRNPLDLLGDATEERYKTALEACSADKNIDLLLVVMLPQTPLLDLEKLAAQTITLAQKSKKPIVAIITGSSLAQRFAQKLEEAGIPCYDFPVRAVRAINALVERSWLAG